MIRLALMLTVFVSFAVAAVAQADPPTAVERSASAKAEQAAPAEEASESSRPARRQPRWVPRQARRPEAGPAVTPYPLLFTPTGIPNLGF